MLTRQIDYWGLGLELHGAGKGLLFAHGGVNEGFEGWLIALAETGQGVVIMTNADHSTELIDEIVKHIRKEYAWPQ
jgi:hypothetical protein